mmetsp:Transcript_16424/g.53787  ORF Transcript_16424/g.53787 Transcript_16424/m.53787 type:complete len:274 (-) Transcript_16424:432-1253(-)
MPLPPLAVGVRGAVAPLKRPRPRVAAGGGALLRLRLGLELVAAERLGHLQVGELLVVVVRRPRLADLLARGQPCEGFLLLQLLLARLLALEHPLPLLLRLLLLAGSLLRLLDPARLLLLRLTPRLLDRRLALSLLRRNPLPLHPRRLAPLGLLDAPRGDHCLVRHGARGEDALCEGVGGGRHAGEARLLLQVVRARLLHLQRERRGVRLVQLLILRLLRLPAQLEQVALPLAPRALEVVVPLAHGLEPLLELLPLVHQQHLLLAHQLAAVLLG